MDTTFQNHLARQLDEIREAGLEKTERVLESPQHARITVGGQSQILNLCANNYLGLAGHPDIQSAAQAALQHWGYGLSSVRFICGTQSIHRDLEARLTEFLGTEDTLLYSSCFDANTGLFETLLTHEDAVISDALNHASIIDGIRLCKARRFRYRNNDMNDLEHQLQQASECRFRLIATDGVFSMDGSIADLPAICDLADRYNALVMVDDSHAVGILGENGRGSHEYHDLIGRIDILTGTLGKALGGASGGYTSGRREIVELLRQRSRPYLFSNTLAPVIAGTSIHALTLITSSPDLRNTLHQNTRFFREQIQSAGYTVLPGYHPIIPLMLNDARNAGRLAEAMLARGVYVIAFSYPVVPQGLARIRVQISAAHTREDLAFAVEQFAAAKKELDL